jgi:hypothetical protein
MRVRQEGLAPSREQTLPRRPYYIGGSALPGGPMPTDSRGHSPIPIVRVPSKNPIAGPQTVTSDGSNLAQLAYYTSPDGVPRKMTLLVTVNTGISLTSGGGVATAVGLYVKVSYGMDRGNVVQWIAAPCVFPIEGSWVKVEAIVGKAPFRLQNSGAKIGTPPLPPGPATYSTQATALLVDGWTDVGPSIVIAQSTACNAVLATGPMLVDSVAFTNTDATNTVLMFISDTTIPTQALLSVNALTQLYVPPKATVSVGPELLGAMSNACYAVGVTSPTSGTIDALGTGIYAIVRGRYLLPGGM